MINIILYIAVQNSTNLFIFKYFSIHLLVHIDTALLLTFFIFLLLTFMIFRYFRILFSLICSYFLFHYFNLISKRRIYF